MNVFQFIFLKLFPDLRTEVGCVFSLVAVYLILDQNMPTRILAQLSVWHSRPGGGPLSVAVVGLILGLLGLAYPFFRLLGKERLSARLGPLHMAVCVVILLVVLGAIAADALRTAFTSPSGPWLNVCVAVLAFLEFGFLVLGGLNLLDHPALLNHLLGPSRPDWRMLGQFFSLTLVLIVLQQVTLWISAFECAMVIVQIVWVVSCLSRRNRDADPDALEDGTRGT